MDFKKLSQIKTSEEWLEPLMNIEGDNAKAYFSSMKKRKPRLRAGAAALFCILVLGMGVTAAAATSDAFRAWLVQVFGEQKVSEENVLLDLKENTQIFGERESFVCEYHFEGEDEIVAAVYMVQGDKLKELTISSFEGKYDGVPFSFDYTIINQEICGFNYKGDLNEVFHYVDDDTVYAALWHGEDTIEKACIAALNLKTGEVEKLSGDNMICNYVMSPNGKVILCNHRGDGYWAVFDIATKSEKKVEAINGYARTREIQFLDDYHILTLGKLFRKGDVEWYSTYLIELRTGEIMEEYKDYGEINMQWVYALENYCLKLSDITNGDTFFVDSVEADVHLFATQGSYALFGCLEEEDAPFYLVNLENQSSMKIDMPKELKSEVGIYLTAKEKKILVTNGAKAYLIDISKM